ncbi:7915_t:CDS:2, partial [Ambispora leptoticha]
MSVPISQQQQLIKKYFNLLVKEFITDPRHNEDIRIVFEKDLGSEGNVTTLGNTERSGDEEQLRGTVVHEFTHLYLYSTVGKHDHDDRFYSTMEYLESWLDKNQKLSPRVDKSGDRYQYVGDNSETNDKENTCPECSHAIPHHSPQCSHNQNNPRPTRQSKPGQNTVITNDPQKAAEFDQLMKQLETSQDLATLETTYQNIKDNPLYGNNKKSLDNLYELKKLFLQSSSNNQRSSTNDPALNKSGLGSREYFLI